MIKRRSLIAATLVGFVLGVAAVEGVRADRSSNFRAFVIEGIAN